MSTFMGPPSGPGTSRSLGTLGRATGRATDLSTGGRFSTVRGRLPRGGSSCRHDHAVTTSSTSDPARIRTTRCWTLHGTEGTVDVEVDARDGDTVADLLPPLARALGAPVNGLWAGTTRLADELPLSTEALAHGAVLGVGRPVPAPAAAHRSSALELHVTGGPDAGRTVPLAQGSHLVGRGSEATVALDDPDVSRRHVEVQVGGGTVAVADLGSTNGSHLDDEQLTTEARPWPTGAILHIGATALTVTGPSGSAVAVEGVAGGRLQLRPVPRIRTPPSEVEIALPRPPAPPPHRRPAWVAIALPAAGGLFMAWLLHTPSFLFFAVLSPVVALGTWLSERWSGRRTGRRDAAAHALELMAVQDRLTAAVRTDVRASEAAQPDLATLTAAARRRTFPLWSRTRGDADALTVRVGSGPGPTHVTRVEADGGRVRETAAHVPVSVDLRTGGGLAVLGPRERAAGVLAGVVAQLTALHPPGELDLLLLTSGDRLRDWAWTRWLPHLAPGSVNVRSAGPAGPPSRTEDPVHTWLTSEVDRRRLHAAGRPGLPPGVATGWLVVLADHPLDPRVAGVLRTGREVGVLSMCAADSVTDLPVPVDTVLRLGGETGDQAVLSRHGLPDLAPVIVDRLAPVVADRFARDLARLVPITSRTGLPRHVRLLELVTVELNAGADEGIGGSWSPVRDRLIATLGRTVAGPCEVDLCRDGPHALVAGTTGSGKSELLRALIASLALKHPPDRCSFLLVDYKGGAAFAEAAELPHTVGLVTDLDGQTTARALRSLAAELTHREAVLAAHGVAEIADLPPDADMARLVIVVDEFATLAEELPSFVPGLVAIAQRGRSLGVHLVLATQRPAGVVSPEIRANCTLRICLRTTDEADSRDVLGTPQAAHLPVDLPGRAYLRSGSGTPTALQVASVATAGACEDDGGPDVRRWSWPVARVAPAEQRAGDGGSDLARVARGLRRHADRSGRTPPRRPWLPPLPERITAESLDRAVPADRVATRLHIGLVDRPDRQAREPLELDLADAGTWLVVGGPRSGRTTVLRTVLGEAVHRLGPDELHVHVLTSDGGLLAAEASALPHTGTVVSGDDALRTVRLVDRLAAEVAARRARGEATAGPRILLLIDGFEPIGALLDEADPGRGSAHLLRLLRDGAAVGLTCVLTADRAVPGGRLAAVAGQRLTLPLPDRADYALAGIPARAVPSARPAGRAVLGEDALECQLALPRPLPAATSVTAAARTTSAQPAPLRIAELPPDPSLQLPAPASDGTPSLLGPQLLLPIGPGGDEGHCVTVDLLRLSGLLVTGPPGSGRSAALDAFSRHLRAAGTPVLRLERASAAAPAGGQDEDREEDRLEGGDKAGLAAWLAEVEGGTGVVLADDVGSPGECPALGRLPVLGAGSGISLVAAATPAQLSSHYQGPIGTLRRSRSGLLLCPGPGDADLLGFRLPRMPLPVRPGSGWLVTDATAERVQVARRRIAVPGVTATGTGRR